MDHYKNSIFTTENIITIKALRIVTLLLYESMEYYIFRQPVQITEKYWTTIKSKTGLTSVRINERSENMLFSNYKFFFKYLNKKNPLIMQS